MTVSVPASQIPVSKKQQIHSEFGSRTFGDGDDGVELKMKMPDMTKGIASLDDVNAVCGQMSALPYKLPSKAVDLVLDFKLKCAWRLEKRIVISDDNTVRWEITKEVRRSVPGGCMVKLSHPKPSGESVGKDKVLYPCAKHWHDTEAAFTKDKQHGWTDKKLKVAKKKRTAKAGTTSTAVSGLRTAELQVEFIRLRDEYLRRPSMPVPPALPLLRSYCFHEYLTGWSCGSYANCAECSE